MVAVGEGDINSDGSFSEEQYLSRAEAMMDIAEGSLIIARGMYPEIDIQSYLGKINLMVEELGKRLQGKTEAHEIIQVINDYLFKEQGFQYQQGTHFMNKVLDQKRGSCIGLSTLYVALTQRLKIPCYAVNIPRHEFVRFCKGNIKINIEVMDGGGSYTDEWYVKECKIGSEAVKKGIYLQNLSVKELLAGILNNRGNVRRLAGYYDKAIRDLDLAISLYPRSVDAYYSRGITHVDMGQYDEGIKDCTTALALDPECAYAYANRGAAYSGKGENDKALADCNRAIALDPEIAGVYGNRGNIYKNKGDLARALEDYERAIMLDNELAPVYYNRANLFLDNGSPERAIQDYNMALQINSRMAVAYFERGKAYTNIREIGKAIDSFGKAIEINPKHYEAYYNRGILHAMTGNLSDAIMDCDRAISLAPQSGAAYFMRAMAYGLKKDKKNALRDLEQALKLDPGLMPVSRRNEAFKDWWSDPEYKRIFE
jgi:tetratricopeptide (TPR) repeat protein